MSSISIIVFQVEPMLKKLFWGIWGNIGGWDIEDIFWGSGVIYCVKGDEIHFGRYVPTRQCLPRVSDLRALQTTKGLRGMDSLALVQCRTSTVLPNKHLIETILQPASFRKGLQSGYFR